MSRYSVPGVQRYPQSTAGVLHPVALWWIFPTVIVTLSMDIATAILYKRLGGQANQSADALFVAGAMQTVLAIFFLARGAADRGWFKWMLTQTMLVFLMLASNTLITGLWAARLQMDATVNVKSKSLYALPALTVTAFFSNLYSSMCAAVLFVNSAYFWSPDSEKPLDYRKTQGPV
jgi:hypothetical protein